MKLPIFFLIIILPGYLVCAEPFLGSFLGSLFHTAGNTVDSGVGLLGGIISSVVDGVKTATHGIIQTIFGSGPEKTPETSITEPQVEVTSQVPNSPPVPDVAKSEASVDTTAATSPPEGGTPVSMGTDTTPQVESSSASNEPTSGGFIKSVVDGVKIAAQTVFGSGSKETPETSKT